MKKKDIFDKTPTVSGAMELETDRGVKVSK